MHICAGFSTHPCSYFSAHCIKDCIKNLHKKRGDVSLPSTVAPEKKKAKNTLTVFIIAHGFENVNSPAVFFGGAFFILGTWQAFRSRGRSVCRRVGSQSPIPACIRDGRDAP